MTAGCKTYVPNTMPGFLVLGIVFTKSARSQGSLPFLKFIILHDLTKPECGSQWLQKTKSDASLWSRLKAWLYPCMCRRAGRDGMTKPFSLQQCCLGRNQPLHDVTKLSHPHRLYHRPTCFKYWSLWIFDILFIPFSFSAPKFLKQLLEYVHYSMTCITHSCCKMLEKHCNRDWKGHMRISFRITNAFDWDELHI